MKVIFLDHDGVICLEPQWGGRFDKQDKVGRKMSQDVRSLPVSARFDDFDKEAVEVLNSILEETGAEIVVSSDWKRWADSDELGEYYKEQGIIKTPIDTTSFFNDVEVSDDFPWDRTQIMEQQRSLEILQWLEDHPDVNQWVSVDDLHMGTLMNTVSFGMVERDWGLPNFVWTPHPKLGIRDKGVREDIIKSLSD